MPKARLLSGLGSNEGVLGLFVRVFSCFFYLSTCVFDLFGGFEGCSGFFSSFLSKVFLCSSAPILHPSVSASRILG